VLGPLLAALAAAVAFGAAALLQAVAARRETRAPGADPALLLRMLRHPEFLAALALNGAGFGLHVVAVRGLPLFLAQVVISSSVAVTALLGAHLLHVRLTPAAATAVAAVCAGLGLLAASAGSTGDVQADVRDRALLLGAVVAVAVLGALATRVPAAPGASLLGLAAGLGFGVVAVAARVAPDLAPGALVRDPATWALVAGGTIAFHHYSAALQRGGVLTATSAMTVAQTVGPALVGVLALGDEVRAGALPLAVAGLALAVTGVAVLTRYDEHALAAVAAGQVPPTPPGTASTGRRIPGQPRAGDVWHSGARPRRSRRRVRGGR
jgi:drug/metabolite transporter (DMT)-like permease